MTRAATAPIRIFLLPPLDSVSALAPPKVNDGAEPTSAGESLTVVSTGFSRGASAGAISCGLATTGASSILRAGAGALAAPLVAMGEPTVNAGLAATGAGNGSAQEFGRIALAQGLSPRATRSVPLACSFGNINGFGQDEVGADAKCLGDPRLTFHDSYGKRRLVGRRVARAFEQKCGILLVIAVDHDSVEVLAHQLLDRSERFEAGLDVELELAQDLRHRASGFFIGTEEKSFVTHIKVIVGTGVSPSSYAGNSGSRFLVVSVGSPLQSAKFPKAYLRTCATRS
jgi:hypothetical protein